MPNFTVLEAVPTDSFGGKPFSGGKWDKLRDAVMELPIDGDGRRYAFESPDEMHRARTQISTWKQEPSYAGQAGFKFVTTTNGCEPNQVKVRRVTMVYEPKKTQNVDSPRTYQVYIDQAIKLAMGDGFEVSCEEGVGSNIRKGVQEGCKRAGCRMAGWEISSNYNRERKMLRLTKVRC